MSNIKRKKKICERCERERYIFADGMCLECNKIEKYSPPARSPLKAKAPKTKPAYGFASQVELFNDLWKKSDKRCPVSDRDLSLLEHTADYWSCFAHILPKGKYTRYKLNPDNIMIVHPEVHKLFDQGTIRQQQQSGWDFSPLHIKRAELLQKYNQNK